MQLALNLLLRDAATFDNYFPARNAEALSYLRARVAALGAAAAIYLAGESGTGKTHLLFASCREADERESESIYIDLAGEDARAAEQLEDIEQVRLICLDNVHAVAGRADWERALFNLWERLRARDTLLVVSARVPPGQCEFGLADLETRLAACTLYALKPLDDEARLAAIRLRALARGLELTEEVARYILQRYPRDMHSLFALLDRLDRDALASRRRVTIPFLRDLGLVDERADKGLR